MSESAAAWCQKHPSAVAQVVGYGLMHAGRSRKDLEELMLSKLKEERMKLERYLAILVAVAPVYDIGLLGVPRHTLLKPDRLDAAERSG